MTGTPKGFRKENRAVYIKQNSDFSHSQQHEGFKSALARDRETNDLSHVVIGEVEDAPDISELVPLALVAGIVAGVAGAKAFRSAKERRRQAPSVEAPPASVATATPAGWYGVAKHSTLLRYWNGVAWTGDYAHRSTSVPSIAADWYPDPSNAAQLRYWDGTVWTHHIAPRPGTVTASADWYPDPSNASQLRYWDGVAWTDHITAGGSTTTGPRPIKAGSNHARASGPGQSRVTMSSEEWQAHVRAWLRAGAIQQELWSRLSRAHVQDADDNILSAQQRMEALTPEQVAFHIQRMLETHPPLSEQGALLAFRQLFGGDSRTPMRIDAHREGRPRHQ